jgi:UDPglucose 6-dehydrogenase
MEEAAKILPDVIMASSAYDAAQDAHAVALITEWDAYRALDLKKLHAAMAGDVLVDLRNIYRPEDTAAAGFKYVSVGR